MGRGDHVLLTAQTDSRENGIWAIGGGSTVPAEENFHGMLVRILVGLVPSHIKHMSLGLGGVKNNKKKALLHSVAGTVAGGWMFCCIALNTVTRAAAFGPVVSPLPSKGQLDSIRIDASTLDGKAPEQYINKTLESAGGSVSLIVNGTQHSVLLG